MSTCYRDFAELVLHATKDVDYALVVRDRSADVTVAAIHGGRIEPLTGELAAAIAGEEHNLYELRGLRAGGNAQLRVPVARYEEMRLRNLVRRSRMALAVLGVPGEATCVHLGGGNRRLRELVADALHAEGFAVGGPTGSQAAHHPGRFYNAALESGVQIELTHALREELAGRSLEGTAWESAAERPASFSTFVDAVRGSVQRYLDEAQDDLDAALRRFDDMTEHVLRAVRERDNGHHAEKRGRNAN